MKALLSTSGEDVEPGVHPPPPSRTGRQRSNPAGDQSSRLHTLQTTEIDQSRQAEKRKPCSGTYGLTGNENCSSAFLQHHQYHVNMPDTSCSSSLLELLNTNNSMTDPEESSSECSSHRSVLDLGDLRLEIQNVSSSVKSSIHAESSPHLDSTQLNDRPFIIKNSSDPMKGREEASLICNTNTRNQTLPRQFYSDIDGRNGIAAILPGLLRNKHTKSPRTRSTKNGFTHPRDHLRYIYDFLPGLIKYHMEQGYKTSDNNDDDTSITNIDPNKKVHFGDISEMPPEKKSDFAEKDTSKQTASVARLSMKDIFPGWENCEEQAGVKHKVAEEDRDGEAQDPWWQGMAGYVQSEDTLLKPSSIFDILPGLEKDTAGTDPTLCSGSSDESIDEASSHSDRESLFTILDILPGLRKAKDVHVVPLTSHVTEEEFGSHLLDIYDILPGLVQTRLRQTEQQATDNNNNRELNEEKIRDVILDILPGLIHSRIRST